MANSEAPGRENKTWSPSGPTAGKENDIDSLMMNPVHDASRRLVLLATHFFPRAFPGECRFRPLFFSRLQVIRVFLYFFNDVFLLHFTLEAAERVFQRFALLDDDFSHPIFTPIPILCF
jgi:hypothetical protein